MNNVYKLIIFLINESMLDLHTKDVYADNCVIQLCIDNSMVKYQIYIGRTDVDYKNKNAIRNTSND